MDTVDKFVLVGHKVNHMLLLSAVLLLMVGPAEPQSSSSPDVVFNILEEENVGTFVGGVTANQALFRNLTSSQRKQLSYGLLDQSGYPSSLFRVDESSGDIFVAKRIDRESESCYRKPECRLDFNVALSSARIPFYNIASVRVYVTDKNDNAPYFPAQEGGSLVLDLSEQAPVGTRLTLSGAADRDQDRNFTVQRYALTAYTGVFAVSSAYNLDGSSVLDLRLLQPLDREVLASYRFAILAYDGGSPPLSAALTLQVRVTDENDNRPVFLNASYLVELRDEVTPGQFIVRVSASDLDSGPYGELRYQFSSLQREQLEKRFHVDAVTGDVSAASPLSAGLHQFIVEAVDGGSPPLKSQTGVTVRVLSSRNTPPSVQVNTLSDGSNAFVEIPEDAAPGAFVAFVTADDPDEGARGEVSCRLNGGVLRLEALQGKGYTLTLQRALDRETKETYNVTVTCSDGGDPPLSSERSLMVVVTDVNDRAPVFTWGTFTHTVLEGNYTNRSIIQVSARDEDVGRNAEIMYSLEAAASPPFYFSDPSVGIISATGVLDREECSYYTFKVYASDKGPNSETATADVIIHLEDVNDQYPQFNRSIFEFRVPENAESKTILGTLTAYDLDQGDNGKVEFFYASSVDGSDPFVVERDGMVWSSGGLDRELRETFSFTVMVRDKGVPPKTTYASVAVTVLDTNDNSPKIQFPAGNNHTIHLTTVPEDDMVLAKIVAYDSDLGENGSLHFLVLSGNDDGSLDIDPSGGQLKVVTASRLRNRGVYRLQVAVEDYGVPPRRTETTIFVEVNFDNSSATLFREDNLSGRTEDYVLIVAAVAGTTVVLSAIIIGAICFIFRQDHHYRGKRHPQGPGAHHPPGLNEEGDFFSPFPTSNVCDDEKLRPSLEEEGDPGPTSKPPPGGGGGGGGQHQLEDEYNVDDDDGCGGVFKKQAALESFRSSQRKKEVTFAEGPLPEDSMTSGQGHTLDGETGSVLSSLYRNLSPGHHGSYHHSDKNGDAAKPHPPFLNRQLDEVGSDTSGETGTSDSGRGGSEDDVNIEHILHGERTHGPVPSVLPSVDNERYTRFPPPRAPRRGAADPPHKPYHVRFDGANTDLGPREGSYLPPNYPPRSGNTATTPPSQERPASGQRTVTFSPLARGTQGGPSLFSARSLIPSERSRGGDAAATGNCYRDVSFSPLPQQSPVRTLSTFSLPPSAATASFATFHKAPREGGRSASASQSSAALDDDASTTTSGSYTINPEDLRIDGYIGADVIV